MTNPSPFLYYEFPLRSLDPHSRPLVRLNPYLKGIGCAIFPSIWFDDVKIHYGQRLFGLWSLSPFLWLLASTRPGDTATGGVKAGPVGSKERSSKLSEQIGQLR